MRLLISGGGTGGHVYPALTVVAAVRRRASAAPARPDDAFLYLGRAASVEARLAERAHIPFAPIETGQVRGKAPWIVAQSLWRMVRSIGRVRAQIRQFEPQAIFVTGGYVSAPVIWAGAAEKIPSVIYLPDLEPGWAIRVTSRWATRVAVSFPQVEAHFPRGKAVTTGYPVRAEFFDRDQRQARARLHLAPDARTVTIFGGSSGAHHLNQAVVANLAALTRLAQIVHLTGRAEEAWVKAQVEHLSPEARARVRVFGYLDDELPDALAAADCVVARAGAATLGEFPALGVPAILVPGPYAGMHQGRNAAFLVARGAAIRVEDAVIERELMPTLQKLFDAPETLARMSAAMRALANPNAARNIVELLERLAK